MRGEALPWVQRIVSTILATTCYAALSSKVGTVRLQSTLPPEEMYERLKRHKLTTK